MGKSVDIVFKSQIVSGDINLYQSIRPNTKILI